MADEPEIVYRFTPPFDGAFLRNVPKRDLTQADVDRMTGDQLRDAFAVHPGYGTPTYTAVGSTGDDVPKWFADKLAKAKTEGVVIQPMQPKETQKAYEERVGEQAPVPVVPADADAPPVVVHEHEPGDGSEDGDA